MTTSGSSDGTGAVRLQRLLRAVAPWLAAEHPEASDVAVEGGAVPSSGGFSNGTELFAVTWTDGHERHTRRLVLRTPPEGPTLLHRPTLDLQIDAMRALAGSGVPVPTVVWAEHDPAALGCAYYLMDEVPASRPGPDSPPYTQSGWIMDLAPSGRRRLHESCIEAMAALHAIAPSTLTIPALTWPDRSRSALDVRLGFCQEYYDYAAQALGQPNHAVERGLDWLAANRPATEGSPVLMWGDSRIGNVLFEGDGVEVTALLDWEFACLADPAHEIAHWLYGQRYFTEGIGAPLPDGFPDRAETIAYYEQVSGRRLTDLEFYDVMLALIGAVNTMRVARMSIDAGWLPPDTDMGVNNGGTHILRRLLGEDVRDLPARSFAKG